MQKILNLKEVKLSKREEETLTDTMSNLPKLNEALADEELCDIETVRRMLALEKRTKQRLATLTRLSGRFKTLLCREIDHEIAAS